MAIQGRRSPKSDRSPWTATAPPRGDEYHHTNSVIYSFTAPVKLDT